MIYVCTNISMMLPSDQHILFCKYSTLVTVNHFSKFCCLTLGLCNKLHQFQPHLESLQGHVVTTDDRKLQGMVIQFLEECAFQRHCDPSKHWELITQ